MSVAQKKSIAMCEECERVPVPVYFVTHGRLSGLWICATCLGGEGIHLEEDSAALLDNDVLNATTEGNKK